MSGIDGEGQRLLGQLLKISGGISRQSGDDAPDKSLNEKFNSVTRWFGQRSSMMSPLAQAQLDQLEGEDVAAIEAIGSTSEQSSDKDATNEESISDLRKNLTSMLLDQGVSIEQDSDTEKLILELSASELKMLTVGGLDFSTKELALQLHALLGEPSLDVDDGDYLVDPFPAAVRSHIHDYVDADDLKAVLADSLTLTATEDLQDLHIRPSRSVLGIANRLPEAVSEAKTAFDRFDYAFLGAEADYPVSLSALSLRGRMYPVIAEQGNWMARGLEFGDNAVLHGYITLDDSSVVPVSINISIAA